MIKSTSKFLTPLRSLQNLQNVNKFSYLPLLSYPSNFSLLITNKCQVAFSTNSNQSSDSEKPDSKIKSTENADESKSTIKNKEGAASKDNLLGLNLEQFASFIRDENAKHSSDIKYNSKTIYAATPALKTRKLVGKITFDKELWRTVQTFQIMFWGPLSYITYTYISPLAVLFPLAGFTIVAAALHQTQKLMEKSVMKMDLLNKEKIMLYPWRTQGEGVLCRIEGAKFLGIELPTKQDKIKSIDPDSKESASVEAEFIQDTPTGDKVNVIFRVSPDTSPIENLDLFKHVLYGNTSEVEKFEYSGPVQEEKDAPEAEKKE